MTSLRAPVVMNPVILLTPGGTSSNTTGAFGFGGSWPRDRCGLIATAPTSITIRQQYRILGAPSNRCDLRKCHFSITPHPTGIQFGYASLGLTIRM